MLVLIAIILCLVGGLLVLAGTIGAPARARVSCRRCGYSLIGGALRFAACPECSSDISTDRGLRWSYRRSSRMLWLGGTVALISAAVLAAPWGSIRRAALGSRLLGPTAMRIGAAPLEEREAYVLRIISDMSYDRVSAREAGELASLLLDERRGRRPEWSPAFGEFIEAAGDKTLIERPVLDDYLRWAFADARLVAPVSVEPGYPIRLHISLRRDDPVAPIRLGPGPYDLTVQVNSVVFRSSALEPLTQSATAGPREPTQSSMQPLRIASARVSDFDSVVFEPIVALPPAELLLPGEADIEVHATVTVVRPWNAEPLGSTTIALRASTTLLAAPRPRRTDN